MGLTEKQFYIDKTSRTDPDYLLTYLLHQTEIVNGAHLGMGGAAAWATQNFGWVGHNALGPTNIGMYVP